MASWGCPHEINGRCQNVQQLPCDPGMKGCVLAGRYIFTSSEEKNVRLREKQARKPQAAQGEQGAVEPGKKSGENRN